MTISIRTKLVFIITGFTVVLLGITAYLFINEKVNEMTHDIFLNTVQFADLSSDKIVGDYDTYFEEEGFVYFNREVRSVLAQNGNVYGLKLINYKGDILYDSRTDKTQKYTGLPRVVESMEKLYQVQAVNPSVMTFDGRIVYLMEDGTGEIEYVDDTESKVGPIKPGTKIGYFVQPVSSEFAVVYEMTYENLLGRVAAVKTRIFYLALFGFLIGIMLSFVFSKRISKSIQSLVGGAKVIAKGDFDHRVYLHTNDELEILGNAFNKMAEDLGESTKAIVYREQVKKELELAASIQMGLLPQELPKVAGIDLAAGLLPADEVGGDLYDFIMKDDNNLIAYIGDVTGHGVPAAIVASVANALFYTFSNGGDIKEVLVQANKVLKDKTTTNMFITLCMVHFDALAGKMNYVSAGHEQILLYKAKEKKVMEMPAGGMALGMVEDVSSILNISEIPMEEGDTIVLYSDGIPEAWKSKTESYGMPKLKRAVQEYSDLPTSEAIKNALLADVKEFTGKYKQMDDMTLLVFKRK
jgi:HAMP domain-containing protein